MSDGPAPGDDTGGPALPDELAAVLARDDRARAAFEALAPSHRLEYASWVAEARRPDSRARRAQRAAQMLCE